MSVDQQSGQVSSERVDYELSPAISRSRRFLWLIRGDEGYGFRRANLGLAQSLKEKSVEIGFVSMGRGPFADEIALAGYPLWILDQFRDSDGIRRNGWRFLSGCFQLLVSSVQNRSAVCEAIRSFKPDWLHVSINSLLITAGTSARKTGIPAYWHLHNTIGSKLPFELQSLGYQIICRFFGIHAMANSKHTANSLGSTFCKASILYPGTDASYFSREAKSDSLTRRELGLDPEIPLFVIAARLVPDKAQDLVVDAAIELFQAGKRFSLLLVGGPLDTPFCKKIRERIVTNSVEDLIHIIGPVDDTRPYINISDVVINSRSGAEPFGLSIVEAMLMERPVLAYALGGPSETIADTETGWLIQDSSVEGFKAGMARVLNDSEEWSDMGRAARKRALNSFSLQTTTMDYLDIIDHG